jgi:hypothetical protein
MSGAGTRRGLRSISGPFERDTQEAEVKTTISGIESSLPDRPMRLLSSEQAGETCAAAAPATRREKQGQQARRSPIWTNPRRFVSGFWQVGRTMRMRHGAGVRPVTKRVRQPRPGRRQGRVGVPEYGIVFARAAAESGAEPGTGQMRFLLSDELVAATRTSAAWKAGVCKTATEHQRFLRT